MRELVTIRHIDDLLPIEGADLIEVAVIGGWTVVVKKNEFEVGDQCVYFEIDSFLPDGNPAWQSLVDKHPRMFEGQRGHRLRTVRLRGQVSQGFCAPLSAFPDVIMTAETGELILRLPDGDLEFETFVGVSEVDLSLALNVKKFELPVPAELAGMVRGNFPGFIPKTDQERCQNIGDDIFIKNEGSRYEVTMKMDGTSFTGFYRNNEDGVCGRNWELQVNDSNASNTLVRMFIDSGLRTALRELGENYAVQGELMGPGIQKNREGFNVARLFVFDIYDIDNASYFSPHQRHEVMVELWNRGLDRKIVEHVPVLAMAVSLDELNIESVNQLLQFAEGPSYTHPVREGLVFKRIDGGFSFKAISNAFLLKEKD